MDRAAALGVSTAVLASMIGAGTLPREAKAATPKRGGHLRIGSASGNTSDSLDPQVMTSEFTNIARQAFRSTTTEVDHTGKAVPELAESWEPGDSAATWIFNLRKDVTFHDGKPFEANDVIQTMNYHKSEGSKSVYKAFAKTVTEMKEDGKHRIVFQLEGRNANFPFLASSFEILSFKKDDSTAPYDFANGTGSYIIKDFVPGQHITLERNPNH